MTGARSLKLQLIAIDPPFGDTHGVLFGVQSGGAVENPVPAVETTVFDMELEVVDTGSAVDFRGDFVHGKRGDRFLYLAWGLSDQNEPFVMFARAKVKLADIPTALCDLARQPGHVLVCHLEAANNKGQPASGTISAPAVTWHVEP